MSAKQVASDTYQDQEASSVPVHPEPGILEEARKLFYLGLESQSRGKLAEAESRYLRVLSLVPDRVSALVNLSAVLIQQKKYEEAIPYIDKALELDPDDEVAWLNRGKYFYFSKKFHDALSCCEKAIALKPDFPEAHADRGTILTGAGRHEEALASFDQALAIKPDFVDALFKRGLALKAAGRNEEALTSFNQALAVKPDHAEALQHRGLVYRRLGRHEEAIASYRAALECGGNAEELRYFLAALGADSPPPVSPPSLMVGLFDSYADGFDQHQAALQYRVPEALFDAVSAAAPAGGWDIADLGCGTGQCGSLFRPIARTLAGVDLSSRMIEKARERAVYDELVQGDAAEFLRARAGAFDLLIAADVFIYIGDLGPVFSVARKALRRGGQFAFSLETHEGEGFVLRSRMRYAQSMPYLRACAAAHGFVESSVTPITVRKDFGEDIAGVIAVLRLRDD